MSAEIRFTELLEEDRESFEQLREKCSVWLDRVDAGIDKFASDHKLGPRLRALLDRYIYDGWDP